MIKYFGLALLKKFMNINILLLCLFKDNDETKNLTS